MFGSLLRVMIETQIQLRIELLIKNPGQDLKTQFRCVRSPTTACTRFPPRGALTSLYLHHKALERSGHCIAYFYLEMGLGFTSNSPQQVSLP